MAIFRVFSHSKSSQPLTAPTTAQQPIQRQVPRAGRRVELYPASPAILCSRVGIAIVRRGGNVSLRSIFHVPRRFPRNSRRSRQVKPARISRFPGLTSPPLTNFPTLNGIFHIIYTHSPGFAAQPTFPFGAIDSLYPALFRSFLGTRLLAHTYIRQSYRRQVSCSSRRVLRTTSSIQIG